MKLYDFDSICIPISEHFFLNDGKNVEMENTKGIQDKFTMETICVLYYSVWIDQSWQLVTHRVSHLVTDSMEWKKTIFVVDELNNRVVGGVKGRERESEWVSIQGVMP